jgi:alpha-beta hydrolase superfamily lysophospholipase
MTDHSRLPVLPELRRWRLAPDAWRLAGRVTPARLERYLRYRSAKALPESIKARFRAMGIPQQTISEVLGGIRGLGQWMDGWNLAAQRFLAEARGEERSGRWHEAAIARVNAAMCFHIAHLVTDTDPRTLRTLRASCVTTFAQAAPRLMPQVRKIGIPWRTHTLPAYVAIPTRGDRPHPTLVMLNGATTCKEELLIWAMPLLDTGIAVMTIDWPGTGESASFTSPVADCDDMTDGIVDFVASHPDLDAEWVVVGGVSLGGAVAIRCAAFDRRVLGVMAVTPPYDPLAWWPYVNPLVRLQLMTLAYNADSPVDVIGDFGVGDLLPRLRSPLLVFGAGRDMVVPAEESIELASAAGELATLVWYPEGGHGLYHELDDWIALTGEWLNGLVGRGPVGMPAEPVGPSQVSTAVREAPPTQTVTATAQQRPGPDLIAEPESTRVDSATVAQAPGQAPAAGAEDESLPEQDEDDIWDE